MAHLVGSFVALGDGCKPLEGYYVEIRKVPSEARGTGGRLRTNRHVGDHTVHRHARSLGHVAASLRQPHYRGEDRAETGRPLVAGCRLPSLPLPLSAGTNRYSSREARRRKLG
jgi:hypothetical protein